MLVTQLQNCSQVELERCCESVAVILIKRIVRPSGKWWRYYAPVTLRRDMKDGLVTLPSPGQAAGVVTTCKENLHFLTLLMYLY